MRFCVPEQPRVRKGPVWDGRKVSPSLNLSSHRRPRNRRLRHRYPRCRPPRPGGCAACVHARDTDDPGAGRARAAPAPAAQAAQPGSGNLGAAVPGAGLSQPPGTGTPPTGLPRVGMDPMGCACDDRSARQSRPGRRRLPVGHELAERLVLSEPRTATSRFTPGARSSTTSRGTVRRRPSNSPPAAPGAFNDGANLRRGRLFFEGTLYQAVDYKFELEFFNGIGFSPAGTQSAVDRRAR